METTNKIQDQIDRYVLNQMSTSERIAFEQYLNTDSELKESVELQEMLAHAIKQRRWAERTIENAKEKAARRARLIKFTSIASSIAAILIVAFFINQSYVNNKVYNTLFTQYYSSTDYMPVKRGNDPLKEAIVLLNDEDFKNAKILLIDLYNNNDINIQNEDILWYLALTEIKLHNKKEALSYLYEIKNSEKYGDRVESIVNSISN